MARRKFFNFYRCKCSLVWVSITLGQVFCCFEGMASASACHSSLSQASHSAEWIELEGLEVYVPGNAESKDLLFLHSADYRDQIHSNNLPLGSIIVLDELPLVDALPMVGALIVKQKLTALNNHVVSLAERIGIPIVYTEDLQVEQKLKDLHSRGGGLQIRCDRESCRVGAIDHSVAVAQRPESVLPISFDRSPHILFHGGIDLKSSPRELVGDKYYSLMELKLLFPNLVPDISGVSTGFFETFLDETYFEGHSIRFILNQRLNKINFNNQNRDEQSLIEAHQYVQEAILKGQSPAGSVFEELEAVLSNHYGGHPDSSNRKPYIVRSSNSEETLIGDGLYTSKAIKGLHRSHLEIALRQVWASLFDYQSYTVRRYWRQREENQSMAELVHPYISNIEGHAEGYFRYKTTTGLELHLSLVLGADEKATNPTSNAKVANLVIRKNSKGRYRVSILSRTNGTLLSMTAQKALLKVMTQLEDHVAAEFEMRRYTPEKIKVELVIERQRSLFKKSRVQILQYQRVYNREIVALCLNGMLNWNELDERAGLGMKSNQSKDVFRVHWISTLAKARLAEFDKMIESREIQMRRPKVRFALLIENGQPFFILWTHYETHAIIKDLLERTNAVWYKSGYLVLTENRIGDFTLKFSPTGSTGVDRALHIDRSKDLFQRALDFGIAENTSFKNVLETYKPVIEFVTTEGAGTLNYELRTDFH